MKNKSVKQAVVLAAGASSRFWPLNTQHKSLIKIMGKPIIWHTISGLLAAGLKNIIVVQGPKKDIEKELKNYDLGVKIRYVVQPEPKGMGEALSRVEDLISGPFFVLHGHKVNIRPFVSEMAEKFEQTKDPIIFLGAKTDQPWLYGILKIKGRKISGLKEKPKKGREPSDVRVVGAYLLSPVFFEYHKKTCLSQYSFEAALNLLAKENGAGLVLARNEYVGTYKYPWHLFEAVKFLMDKYLEPKIAKSSQIGKNVVISGKVFIGENSRIFEGAVIKGPCYIGNDCVVGSNGLIREYSNLENGAMTGALSESARCVFQENSHVHSGFFGDSIFGSGCRVGAGTVTANRRLDRQEVKAEVKGKKVGTGLKSLGVIVGENTKIGINVCLMPGVLIGPDCAVGPGSLVSENLNDNTLFYSQFRNILKKHP